jgi:hypothetical protein
MTYTLTRATRWQFFLLMCEQAQHSHSYAVWAYLYHRHPEIIWG